MLAHPGLIPKACTSNRAPKRLVVLAHVIYLRTIVSAWRRRLGNATGELSTCAKSSRVVGAPSLVVGMHGVDLHDVGANLRRRAPAETPCTRAPRNARGFLARLGALEDVVRTSDCFTLRSNQVWRDRVSAVGPRPSPRRPPRRGHALLPVGVVAVGDRAVRSSAQLRPWRMPPVYPVGFALDLTRRPPRRWPSWRRAMSRFRSSGLIAMPRPPPPPPGRAALRPDRQSPYLATHPAVIITEHSTLLAYLLGAPPLSESPRRPCGCDRSVSPGEHSTPFAAEIAAGRHRASPRREGIAVRPLISARSFAARAEPMPCSRLSHDLQL